MQLLGKIGRRNDIVIGHVNEDGGLDGTKLGDPVVGQDGLDAAQHDFGRRKIVDGAPLRPKSSMCSAIHHGGYRNTDPSRT